MGKVKVKKRNTFTFCSKVQHIVGVIQFKIRYCCTYFYYPFKMWSHQHVSAVLAMYRENPCLYMPKHHLYKNRHARINALEHIRVELFKLGLDVSVALIKNKFNNLRTNFLAQYRKYQASFKSGMGTEEIDKPTLWYYDQMEFVIEHGIPRNAEDSLSQGNELSENDNVDEYEDFIDDNGTYEVEFEQESATNLQTVASDDDYIPAKRIKIHCNEVIQKSAANASTSSNSPTPSNAKNKSRRKPNTSETDFMTNANNALINITNALVEDATTAIPATQGVLKNSIQIFAEFVGSQLEYLQCDENILLETQQDITSIIWAARKRVCRK